MIVPVVLHINQNFFCVILIGKQWLLLEDLICISLMQNDFEYAKMMLGNDVANLLGVCLPFLSLLWPSVYSNLLLILIQGWFFFWGGVVRVFIILIKNISSNTFKSFTNIFFKYVSIHFCNISYHKGKIFFYIKPNLSIFLFAVNGFYILL